MFRSISVAGVSLELEERGEGPPLLFLRPGEGLQPQLEWLDLLAQRFRVIAAEMAVRDTQHFRTLVLADPLAIKAWADLPKIRVHVLLINNAEDLADPPTLGTVGRAFKKFAHGSYVLTPYGKGTHGHFTHYYNLAAVPSKIHVRPDARARCGAMTAAECVGDMEALQA